MQILTPTDWQDYDLLDTGHGQRLERFGQYLLVRPDPQAIWQPRLDKKEWQKADGLFEKTAGDKGKWIKKNPNLPDKWLISYQNLKFWVKLSPFKHTGVFPEQAVHWQFITETIEGRRSRVGVDDRKPSILNLFGYTGISSLAALAAGAKVTHVDASYPTIGWFQDNLKASQLNNKEIRWILDDVVKFVQREVKRGAKYDGIIMDPPIYGHGPKGEKWDFYESFPELLQLCTQLLSDRPLFVIINTYAISASALMLENLLKDHFPKNLKIESGELALTDKADRLLSTGIFARAY